MEMLNSDIGNIHWSVKGKARSAISLLTHSITNYRLRQEEERIA